jgi:hypothetical protein
MSSIKALIPARALPPAIHSPRELQHVAAHSVMLSGKEHDSL